jgi:hypothetical protein
VKRIRLSDHALLKIELLKRHSIEVDEDLVKDIVTYPDRVKKGHKERLIAQKPFGKNHVLRVVYEEHTDHILVITLYPGRKERYEKN